MSPPTIELMSLQPGGGKTHMLHHLIALSVLPPRLGGLQRCVVLLDTDGRFSVSRLVQQLESLAKEHDSKLSSNEIEDALKHVHIYYTQSLASTIATVQSMLGYLFDSAKHRSSERPVGFMALDSASAFTWQARAEHEDSALLATTSKTSRSAAPQASSYAQLAADLRSVSKALDCPLIYTSWYQGQSKNASKFQSDAYTYRPSLPSPWNSWPNLRLVVRRTPVRKFPVEMTVGRALIEADHRRKVVEEGRFECFVNSWGVDDTMLQRALDGARFEFRIIGEGIVFQRQSPSEATATT